MSSEPRLGLLTRRHAVPFQCSTRVRDTPPASVPPAAQTSPRDVADTPLRKLRPEPRFGLRTIRHPVPFQCSIRDLLTPSTVSLPTAQTPRDDAAATSAR